MARDTKRAEAKLAELEGKKTRLVAKLESAEADLAAARAAQQEADRLEALVELGDASAKDAQRQRASADKAEAEARRQERTLENAITELDRQIATARQTVAHTARDAASHDQRDAVRKRNEAAKDVEKALAVAVERTRVFARLRDTADDAAKQVKEACDTVGEDPPEFPELDEPEFRPDGWQWLLELVQQGPKQPLADSAKAQRRHRERVRRSEQQQIRVAVATGFIPPGTAEHVRVKAKQAIAEEARRRQSSQDRTWARLR